MENIDNKTNLQQGSSAVELAETLNKNTELNISQLTFKAMLNNSLIIEKFSTWLLAGVGATCALIIANINSITKITGPSIIKYSLLILIISGLFGFLSKYYSIQIKIILDLDEIIRNLLPKTLEVHIEEEKRVQGIAKEQGVTVNTLPNIMGSVRKPIDSLFWFNRRKALKGFEKGIKDPLFGYQKGMQFLSFQSAATVLQSICFLLFLCLIAFNL